MTDTKGLTQTDIILDELLHAIQVPHHNEVDAIHIMHRKRTEAIAIAWPGLAAKFAELLDANGREIPRAFRYARNVLIAEGTIERRT